MAVLSITLKKRLLSRNECRRLIAIQLTGAYAAPDVVDFTTMLNPGKAAKAKFWGGPLGSTKALPATDDISTEQYAGYTLQIAQNAVSPTLKNYQLSIYTASNTALNGNIPAALLGVDIVFEIATSQKYE